jgi:hypothetical protein
MSINNTSISTLIALTILVISSYYFNSFLLLGFGVVSIAYSLLVYKNPSFSLGVVLFSGPLLTLVAHSLGLDIYLQMYALLLWTIIFFVKNKFNIHTKVIELFRSNVILGLLLITMYVGMALQINLYTAIESITVVLGLNDSITGIFTDTYYVQLFVRFFIISVLILLAIQNITNLRDFFIGMACVTILTAGVTAVFQFDKIAHMCDSYGFVGFQISNLINRADLAYKLALSFSVIYIYTKRVANFNIYFIIFFCISAWMMLLSGGKGGMAVYSLIILFIAYKKSELRLLVISIVIFILSLILLQSFSICKTSVYINQNMYRLSSGIDIRLTLLNAKPKVEANNNDAKPKVEANNNDAKPKVEANNKTAEIELIRIQKEKLIIKNGSGTHNFFVDLYKNFTIFSFLLILLPLILIVYSAFRVIIDFGKKDFLNVKLIFVVLLFSVFVNFMFSSYVSRNMLFPLLVSVSYFIVNINKYNKSDGERCRSSSSNI